MEKVFKEKPKKTRGYTPSHQIMVKKPGKFAIKDKKLRRLVQLNELPQKKGVFYEKV